MYDVSTTIVWPAWTSRFRAEIARIAVVLAIGTICSAAGAADEESAAKAEAILEKYIEATGGREAYAKLQNRVSEGTIEFVRKAVKVPVSTYEARPNRKYVLFETKRRGRTEEGTDGEIAWQKSDVLGPRIRDGKQNEATLRDATFNRTVHWREIFTSVEYAGEETVNDQPADRVILRREGGESEVWYFDQATHNLVRQDMTAAAPGREMPIKVFLSDYREVDGIKYPFVATQESMDREIRVVRESVKHNVDIPPDRFKLPDDVQALVEKKKAAAAAKTAAEKAEDGAAKPEPKDAPAETPGEEGGGD